MLTLVPCGHHSARYSPERFYSYNWWLCACSESPSNSGAMRRKGFTSNQGRYSTQNRSCGKPTLWPLQEREWWCCGHEAILDIFPASVMVSVWWYVLRLGGVTDQLWTGQNRDNGTAYSIECTPSSPVAGMVLMVSTSSMSPCYNSLVTRIGMGNNRSSFSYVKGMVHILNRSPFWTLSLWRLCNSLVIRVACNHGDGVFSYSLIHSFPCNGEFSQLGNQGCCCQCALYASIPNLHVLQGSASPWLSSSATH